MDLIESAADVLPGGEGFCRRLAQSQPQRTGMSHQPVLSSFIQFLAYPVQLFLESCRIHPDQTDAPTARHRVTAGGESLGVARFWRFVAGAKFVAHLEAHFCPSARH